MGFRVLLLLGPLRETTIEIRDREPKPDIVLRRRRGVSAREREDRSL